MTTTCPACKELRRAKRAAQKAEMDSAVRAFFVEQTVRLVEKEIAWRVPAPGEPDARFGADTLRLHIGFSRKEWPARLAVILEQMPHVRASPSREDARWLLVSSPAGHYTAASSSR